MKKDPGFSGSFLMRSVWLVLIQNQRKSHGNLSASALKVSVSFHGRFKGQAIHPFPAGFRSGLQCCRPWRSRYKVPGSGHHRAGRCPEGFPVQFPARRWDLHRPKVRGESGSVGSAIADSGDRAISKAIRVSSHSLIQASLPLQHPSSIKER